jgi:ABC-type amino acid transport substrate-binding protein
VLNDQGKADGFSVELMKAVADAVGLHLIFKGGLWTQLKEDLAQGHIDVSQLWDAPRKGNIGMIFPCPT